MKEGFMKREKSLPKEEKKMPHWGPDDLSPWGRLGERYNSDAKIAIKKGWVIYDKEHNEYTLTPAGKEEEKRKKIEAPLTPSFYMGAMNKIFQEKNSNGKNKKKK